MADGNAHITDGRKAKAFLLDALKREGFEVAGVAAPGAMPQAPARLARFLDDGHHATMGWLADTAARRSNPRTLWPEVRSIVMAGFNYGPDDDVLERLEARSMGNISVYARNRDYHDVLKGRLKQAAGQFAARTGADVKVFVDTAPVMEKPLAEAAGLGWQGKHTNLVSRAHGSWLFLASIFTDMALPVDVPEADHCGRCRACLDICPTNAFPAPYRLDARRCISYLTIEHHGPIPRAFRKAMGNRIYGCDDCLAVCPWNKFASQARDAKLQAREDLRAPALADLLALDDSGFRGLFSGSPVKRIGRDRFVRNCAIAAGNSGDRTLIDPLHERLGDDSPLVRGAAVWALAQLCGGARFDRMRVRHMPAERSADVLAEWNTAGLAEGEME